MAEIATHTSLCSCATTQARRNMHTNCPCAACRTRNQHKDFGAHSKGITSRDNTRSDNTSQSRTNSKHVEAKDNNC